MTPRHPTSVTRPARQPRTGDDCAPLPTAWARTMRHLAFLGVIVSFWCAIAYAQQGSNQAYPNFTRQKQNPSRSSRNTEQIPSHQSTEPRPVPHTIEEIGGCWASDPASDAMPPEEYHIVNSPGVPKAWSDAYEGRSPSLTSLLFGPRCGKMQWHADHERFCYRIVNGTVQIYGQSAWTDSSPDYQLTSNAVDKLIYNPHNGIVIDNETSIHRVTMCGVWIDVKTVSINTGHLSNDKNRITFEGSSWSYFHYDGAAANWILYFVEKGSSRFDREGTTATR